MTALRSFVATMLATLPLLWPGAVPAQSAAGVHLELNKAEPIDGACRLYLLIDNRTTHGFENLQLDLVGFDTHGIIAQRLLLETAPLPAHKMRLKVFDLGGPCEALGRILINEVMLCKTAGDVAPDCAGMLSASTRTAIELVP